MRICDMRTAPSNTGKPNFYKKPTIVQSSEDIRLLLDSRFRIRQTLPSLMTTESNTHTAMGYV